MSHASLRWLRVGMSGMVPAVDTVAVNPSRHFCLLHSDARLAKTVPPYGTLNPRGGRRMPWTGATEAQRAALASSRTTRCRSSSVSRRAHLPADSDRPPAARLCGLRFTPRAWESQPHLQHRAQQREALFRVSGDHPRHNQVRVVCPRSLGFVPPGTVRFARTNLEQTLETLPARRVLSAEGVIVRPRQDRGTQPRSTSHDVLRNGVKPMLASAGHLPARTRQLTSEARGKGPPCLLAVTAS
jgi:hypothetical protein